MAKRQGPLKKNIKKKTYPQKSANAQEKTTNSQKSVDSQDLQQASAPTSTSGAPPSQPHSTFSTNADPKATSAQKISLLHEAKKLTASPGVYFMKSQEDQILYIGKAKNLKNRVSQYFQATVNSSLRIDWMVSQVKKFDVILTETEAEALLLEATLIKKHKPKFNVQLKDDKNYPYLKINSNDPFPRIEYTRRIQKDGALYFGPFPSAWDARNVQKLLTEHLKLRDCSDNTFRHRSRPCILYQMEKCSAPCVTLITPQEYRKTIDHAVSVLEGQDPSFLNELENKMKEASDQLDYERAAYYRDQITHLKVVTQTQGMEKAGVELNRDTFAMARENANAYGSVLEVRNGKLIAVKHYVLQNTDESLTEQEIMVDFIVQHYRENEILEQHKPLEVMLSSTPENPKLIEEALSIKLTTPQDKEDERLLKVAQTNATYSLNYLKQKEKNHSFQADEAVQKDLHLQKIPYRIECYDISNIQGSDAVASRVVFVNGAPDKNLYRRYKIKTIEGQNDFAMLKEVLGRRFSNQAEALPDLVLIDGGKGQLSQCVAIIDELNIQGVEIASLAKARTESDFKKTEVVSSSERIFIPNRKNPIPLKPHTHSYRLLTHLRNEAHRFAISYHRHLRKKRIP